MASIISSIGSGIGADFDSLSEWWDVVKNINLVASGDRHIAELAGGQHHLTPNGEYMEFDDAIENSTDPSHNHVIRAASNAKFRGDFSGDALDTTALIKYRLIVDQNNLEFRDFVIGYIDQNDKDHGNGPAIGYNWPSPWFNAIAITSGNTLIDSVGFFHNRFSIDEPSTSSSLVGNQSAAIYIANDKTTIQNVVIYGHYHIGSGGTHAFGNNESHLVSAGIHARNVANVNVLNCTITNIQAYLSTNAVIDSGNAWVGAFGLVEEGVAGNSTNTSVYRNNLIHSCFAQRNQDNDPPITTRSTSEAEGSLWAPNFDPWFYGGYIFEYNSGWDNDSSSPDGGQQNTQNAYDFENYDYHDWSIEAPSQFQSSANNLADNVLTKWALSNQGDTLSNFADIHILAGTTPINAGWYGEGEYGGGTPVLGTDFVNPHTPFKDIDGTFRELEGGTACEIGADELGSGVSSLMSLFMSAGPQKNVDINLFIRTVDQLDNHVLGDAFESDTGQWVGGWTVNTSVPGQGFLLASNTINHTSVNSTLLDYYSLGLAQVPYNYDVSFTAVASGGGGGTWAGKYGIMLRYQDPSNHVRVWFDVDNNLIFCDIFAGGSSSLVGIVLTSSPLFLDGDMSTVRVILNEDTVVVYYKGINEATFTLPAAPSLKAANKIGFVTVDTASDSNGYFRIHSITVGNPFLPLYLHSPLTPDFNNTHLFAQGPLTVASGSATLFVRSASGETETTSLYTYAHQTINDSTYLYTSGPDILSESTDLFLHAHKGFNTKYDNAGTLYCDDYATDTLANYTAVSGDWYINSGKLNVTSENVNLNNNEDRQKYLILDADIDRIFHGASVYIEASGGHSYNRSGGLLINYLDNDNYYAGYLSNSYDTANYMYTFVKKEGLFQTLEQLHMPHAIYGDVWENGFKFDLRRSDLNHLDVYVDDVLIKHVDVSASTKYLPSGNSVGIATNIARGTCSGVIWDDFCFYSLQPHLYTKGHITTPENTSLFTVGPPIPTESTNLFIPSFGTIDDSVTLLVYMGDTTVSEESVNLTFPYVLSAGTSGTFNNTSLFIDGDNETAGQTTLYIPVSDTGNTYDVVSLFIDSYLPSISEGTNLYISVSGVEEGTSLFIEGLSLSGAENSAGIPITGITTLFIERNTPQAMPLYISGTSRTNDSQLTSLYLEGVSGVLNESTKLYMLGRETDPTSTVQLYTHGF